MTRLSPQGIATETYQTFSALVGCLKSVGPRVIALALKRVEGKDGFPLRLMA
jgi:hypothetical protein